MSNLTLDGSTSFIGTEFIKLLATGSSDLATVQYVDDAIEQGGGGNVDLSNYYTQTQTDNLLNNKLNVNNPQDITGNLRLDPTNGLSKIILNAVSPPNANDDFYCNGSGQFNGTLRVSVLTSDGDINADGCNADTFNSHITTNDIVFKHNDVEYMRFNATDDTIDLSKELNLGSSTLKINSLNTNGLNDMVFNIDTLGEILRFEVGGTVRVPNTRSFLSQNIFTDIIKPIAFANDVSLQGKNTTSDGYEEYVKINSTTETVDFNKNVNFNSDIDVSENIVMLPNKILYLDEGATNKRYIRSSARTSPSIQNHLDIVQENTSIGRIRLMIGTEENLIVENSQLYSLKVITAVAGVKGNVLNSNGNNNLNIQRNGTSLIILNSSNEIQLQGDLRLPTSNTQYIRFANCNIRQGVATIVYFDFNNDTTTGQYRFFIDGNTILHLRPNTTTISNTLEVNTINSNGNNDVLFQRDGTTKLELKTNEVSYSTDLQMNTNKLEFNGDNIYIRYIVGGDSSDIFDFVNTSATTPRVRYLIGGLNSSDIIMQLYTDKIDCQRNVELGTAYQLKCNNINSNGDNDVLFQRNDVEFFKLDKFTEDTVEKEAIICSKQLRANGNILVKNLQINQFPVGVEYADFRLENADSVMRFYVGNSTSANLQMTNVGLTLGRVATCTAGLKTNFIDTYTDTDLIFRRNGVEYFRLDDLTGTDILNVANDKGVSASYVFGNRFWNRSFSSDTTFFGSNVAGDDRVEYMKWNYLSQSVDYNAPIDNTGLAITGNIIDTTVSDERLKTNIEDVDTDFTSCIKNVKVKTFKYKDDKYKTNDTYGFIAQELKEHLPKECKNIVKENKAKNEDETFLSINYMKLSVVLWKCCQEQQSKIEHLEASMYEMMEDIKELKGKKTTKPKAKAKSKVKSEK